MARKQFMNKDKNKKKKDVSGSLESKLKCIKKKTIINSTFTCSKFSIVSRYFDGYINCLPFLKTINKIYYEWRRLKSTETYLKYFFILKQLSESQSIIKDIIPAHGKINAI
jgi:hypothetical protein